jgi:hypothetical protein
MFGVIKNTQVVVPRGQSYVDHIMSGTRSTYTGRDYNLYHLENPEHVKYFVQNVYQYPYNLDCDETHYYDMHKQLIDDPQLTGPLTLAIYSDMKCERPAELIDGHHRIKAMQKIYETHSAEQFPMVLEIRVYKTDRTNGPITMELYRKLNNTKPYIVIIPIIRDITSKVLENIEKCHKGMLSRNEKPHFPRISFNKLNNKLYEEIVRYGVGNAKSDVISERILMYNRQLSEMSIEHLKKKWEKLDRIGDFIEKYNKAKLSGFFLGFETIENIIRSGF